MMIEYGIYLNNATFEVWSESFDGSKVLLRSKHPSLSAARATLVRARIRDFRCARATAMAEFGLVRRQPHDGHLTEIPASALDTARVTTGFSSRSAQTVRQRLEPLMRKTPPLAKPIKRPDTVWVEPTLEAKVAFSHLTDDGMLQHKGLKS
jgi:hypothetical protein